MRKAEAIRRRRARAERAQIADLSMRLEGVELLLAGDLTVRIDRDRVRLAARGRRVAAGRP